MNAVTQLDQGREALDLNEVDLDDPDAVVDGTPGDDDGDDSRGTNEASNEDQKPSLEDKLKGQDISQIEKECLKAVEDLQQLGKDASLLNAKKEEIRQRMEAKGINRHALSAAVKINNMNDDHLDGYDLSLLILRRAIGNPIQPDLFNAEP